MCCMLSRLTSQVGTNKKHFPQDKAIIHASNRLQDFLRNNRGINDGADLPEEYMSKLYDNIVGNEIKMKVALNSCHVSSDK